MQLQQIHDPNSLQHIKVKEPNKNIDISLNLTNLIADEKHFSVIEYSSWLQDFCVQEINLIDGMYNYFLVNT